MSRRYLALDLGAESGRAMLAELTKGQLALHELHRFSNLPVSLPDGLYWNTFQLFRELQEGLRIAGRQCVELDGIGIDTWGVDFGILGEDGSLTVNPRHYRDQRTAGISQRLFQELPKEQIFAATGIQFLEINSLYQLYALRETSPQVLRTASKLLFMPDLLNYFFTGSVRSERTIASTSQMYNPRTGCFATEMLRRIGITASFFAELIEPGMELGPVLPHIAANCSLGQDVPVFAIGSHDTASAVAAVPATGDDDWCYISSGTWSLMGVETNEPVINDQALAANFTNEVGIGKKIRLLKNIAGLWLLQECRREWARQGKDYSYAELMSRAADARPIESVIDPDEFSSPGNHPERIRHACRRSGQEVPEDEGTLCRVILQSLAERYKQVLNTLEALTGRTIRTIHIVGGGARNHLLNQMVADRTGRLVKAGPVEATAIGNVLTQAMGAGEINSLAELREVSRRASQIEDFQPA